MARHSVPKNDSAVFLFSMSDETGALVNLTPYTIGLTIRDACGSLVYSGSSTLDSETVARLVVPPNTLTAPGIYSGAIRATTLASGYTYSFELEVTDHA